MFSFSSTSFAQINEAARYEIDAKRIGVSPYDKDALPRSREFIRLDSTYYVGYMYEGIYKFDRSCDYLGYKQAIIPLTKALHLFEKDFRLKLQNIFSSINYFNDNKMLYGDFYEISYALRQCYNSIEMPDSSMALLNNIDSYHFQRDFFSVGADRAWLYHRNRFFTSEQHPFLKNSIAENEAMAFSECYKQINYIHKNKDINDYWYGPYQSQGDLLTVYHNLAILHDYNQNYDSSIYYYNVLANGNRVSWSNFANMQHEIGDFSAAAQNYQKPQFRSKFALNESFYYMPMLFVYGAKTKDAIAASQNKILESGSTPGFGWYSIALARGYLYDGQLDSCDFYLDKASNFKELHINTTLTQSQYDFTINLLRAQLIEKKKEQIKFLNRGWWYSPGDLFDIAQLKLEKMLLEYSLVNALANNPERTKIVYNLFCSETTVSFDESMCLLKDFCAPYFKQKYQDYTQNDKRQRINKYFRLFTAEFALEDGDEATTEKICDDLFHETIPTSKSYGDAEDMIDVQYDRLYTYRLLETLAKVSSAKKADDCMENCWGVYPQLIPFSGFQVKMNIIFDGLQNDPVVSDIVGDMKKSKIELTTDANAPKAKISFYKKADTYKVVINVWDRNGKKVVENGELLFKQQKGVGKELVMRLFGKGGAVKLS